MVSDAKSRPLTSFRSIGTIAALCFFILILYLLNSAEKKGAPTRHVQRVVETNFEKSVRSTTMEEVEEAFHPYSPYPLYSHRPYLPPSRIGPEFAHWQILTNRPKGLTRQRVLNTVGICSDLMLIAATNDLKAGSSDKTNNATNRWADLRNVDRMSRHGCDWYWMDTQPLTSEEILTLVKINPQSSPSQLLLDGARAMATNASNVTEVLELAMAAADLGAPQARLLLAEVLKAYNGASPTVIRESARMELVGERRMRAVTMLNHVRPLDVLLEAEWHAKNGTLFESHSNKPNWFVPDPQQLLELSPTSPMLLHVLGNEILAYHHDRYLPSMSTDEVPGQPFSVFVGRNIGRSSSAKTSLHLSEAQAIVDQLYSSTGSSNSDIGAMVNANREGRSMAARYQSMWAASNNYRSTTSNATPEIYPTQLTDIPSLPTPSLPLTTTGQLAVTLRNRLVRLSPSGSPFFESDLIGGMVAVGEGASPPGILSRAPPRVRSSHQDAIAGHWNMSDLPPWLVLPAAVNVGNCLDPLNQRPTPEAGLPNRYQPGEELYQPQRSILVIGCSHARNMFKILCSQYLHSRRMRNPPTSGDTFDLDVLCHGEGFRMLRKDLSNTFTSDDPFVLNVNNSVRPTSESHPIALAYCQIQLEYQRDIEGCANNIYSHLQWLRNEDQMRDDTFTSPTQDGLALNIKKEMSAFASRAFGGGRRVKSDQANTFSYGNFDVSHNNLKGFESIKGLFSHVIFVSGPWESDQMDITVSEHTENIAISLDLIEEYFAPTEKIIMYTMHTAHMLHHDGHPIPLEATTADALKARDITVPSYAGLPVAARGNESTPYGKDNDLGKRLNDFDTFSPVSCRGPFRATIFRDAHLSAVTLETRTRVRSAWKKEFEDFLSQEEATHKGERTRIATTDVLTRRAPVELVDFLPPTAQSLGHLFVDSAGHHYADVVLEAMSQRVLRDHVCPPQFVMAVPPAMRSGAVPTTVPTTHPKRDYAGTGLPWGFPEGLPQTEISYIRVRNGPNAASEMPALAGKGMAGLEISNLFPLIKMPIPSVSRGLRHAIFDNPKSWAGEGAVYRHAPADGRSVKESPLMGSFNQYDPYTVSPFCSCKRATSHIHANYSHPFMIATQDEIRDALSSAESALGAALRAIRIDLGEQQANGSTISNTPYNFSAPHFPLHLNPSMALSPQFILRKDQGCLIEDSNLTSIRHCQGCPRGELYVNTLELLRRRMLSFAYLHARRGPEDNI